MESSASGWWRRRAHTHTHTHTQEMRNRPVCLILMKGGFIVLAEILRRWHSFIGCLWPQMRHFSCLCSSLLWQIWRRLHSLTNKASFVRVGMSTAVVLLVVLHLTVLRWASRSDTTAHELFIGRNYHLLMFLRVSYAHKRCIYLIKIQ